MADLQALPVPTHKHALFLDFDGTLAPLQDDPDTVQLLAGGDEILLELARRLDGALAIISGRDITDLAGRVPAGLWRLGNHGMNALAPGMPEEERSDVIPAQLVAELSALLGDFPGAQEEVKGAVIALHYRACPEFGDALKEAAQAIIGKYDGYSLQAGKMVLEAKPQAASKGLALRRMMDVPPFAGREPIMVGDDMTDEDGFMAALDLGGQAVKVGEGETRAPYRLASQEAVYEWLQQGIGA